MPKFDQKNARVKKKKINIKNNFTGGAIEIWDYGIPCIIVE